MAVDPYPRNVAFSSVYNFRDVGGYPGLDGRTVRWRRLFRADSLHRMKDADLDAFTALGIRTVIDLRGPYEIEEYGRVPHLDGLDYRNLVLEHVNWHDLPQPAEEHRDRWLADRYLNFAEDGRVALRDALALIADPDAAPVVVHCMAGKDRTGVTCALALALAGVSDADIAADYALTTAAMTGLMAYLRQVRPASVDGREHIFTAPAEAMMLFLGDLRERHGSVADYVRDIGVTDEQVAALRSHLLDD